MGHVTVIHNSMYFNHEKCLFWSCFHETDLRLFVLTYPFNWCLGYLIKLSFDILASRSNSVTTRNPYWWLCCGSARSRAMARQTVWFVRPPLWVSNGGLAIINCC